MIRYPLLLAVLGLIGCDGGEKPVDDTGFTFVACEGAGVTLTLPASPLQGDVTIQYTLVHPSAAHASDSVGCPTPNVSSFLVASSSSGAAAPSIRRASSRATVTRAWSNASGSNGSVSSGVIASNVDTLRASRAVRAPSAVARRRT